MRITLGSQNAFAKYAIGTSYSRLVKFQEQVATGKRITRPSDDPVAANQSMSYTQRITDIEQFMRNAGLAKDFMSQTSMAMDELHNHLQEAFTLAQSTINASMSPEAREGIAHKLDAIKNRMLDIANTRHLGRYIFSGHRTDVSPLAHLHSFSGDGVFTPQGTAGVITINGVDVDILAGDTADDLVQRINQQTSAHNVTASADITGKITLTRIASADTDAIQVAVAGGYTVDDVFGSQSQVSISEGYTYNGDAGAIRMQVSSALSQTVNVSAARIFNLDGTSAPSEPDLFRLLDDLRGTIISGESKDIEEQMKLLQSATGRALSMRVEMGGKIQNLEGTLTHLEITRDNLLDLRSKTEDADITEAVVNLKVQEQVYQSALFSASSMFRLSLMDYLR